MLTPQVSDVRVQPDAPPIARAVHAVSAVPVASCSSAVNTKGIYKQGGGDAKRVRAPSEASEVPSEGSEGGGMLEEFLGI